MDRDTPILYTEVGVSYVDHTKDDMLKKSIAFLENVMWFPSPLIFEVRDDGPWFGNLVCVICDILTKL